MNVSLTPELEDLVNTKVKSGMYNSASEVIREGLRLLKQQDEIRQHRLNELRAAVDVGIEQLESGHYTDYDVDNLEPLFDEVRAEGLKQLAEERGNSRK